MAWPDSLDVALKEWATVCHAMATGRQVVLLRKGGIYEAAGGFELEHRQFLFFPTYLHQNPEMLKPEALDGFERRGAEPDRVTLASAGAVTDIIRIASRAQIDAIDDEHVWTSPLIEMRFNYRPDNPLYLLLVRSSRLSTPTTVENTPAYAGCKSWVPLEAAVNIADATPVLNECEYERRRDRILKRISG